MRIKANRRVTITQHNHESGANSDCHLFWQSKTWLPELESQEKSEHPLERIMAITIENGWPIVTTTGAHVARRIDEALSRAYKGQLSLQYGESDKIIRVLWQTDKTCG